MENQGVMLIKSERMLFKNMIVSFKVQFHGSFHMFFAGKTFLVKWFRLSQNVYPK